MSCSRVNLQILQNAGIEEEEQIKNKVQGMSDIILHFKDCGEIDHDSRSL